MKKDILKKRVKYKINKINYLFVLLLFIIIGYSIIQVSHSFHGVANVAAAPQGIYLENLRVKEGSRETEKPAIKNIEGEASVSFEVNFIQFNDFYEFDVDIVNGSRTDAMVKEIRFTGLPEDLKKYFTYSLTYSDGAISANDLLAAGTRETINFRISFNKNVNLADILGSNASDKLSFNMNYEIVYGTAENSKERLKGVKVPLLGDEKLAYRDDGVFPSDQTLFIKSDTVDSEKPIAYFKGTHEDTNNNVIFAGKCWKIIRTTETGGLKLLYNGLPNENKCIYADQGKTSVYIPTTKTTTFVGAFNSSVSNPAHVGYMYSSKASSYGISSKTMTSTSSNSSTNSPIYRVSMTNNNNYYFATGYTVSGSTYTLTNPTQLGKWTTIYSTMAGKGYYTCRLTTTNTCTTLYYVLGGASSYAYTLALTNGNTINQTNTNMIFGTDIIDNGNGTYSLSGTKTNAKKSDWYANYASYKNQYICSDYSSSTCSTMYKLTNTTVYQMTYEVVKEMVFGNDVEWNGTAYVLKDTYTKPATTLWANFYNDENITRRHYTCFNESDTCTNVFYIIYISTTPSYITLKSAKKIENVVNEELFPNSNDRNAVNSTIKGYIDKWFSSSGGMINYTNYLEDTVWCNDRTISDLGSWSKDGVNTNSLYFDSFNRTSPSTITLACNNKFDRFTLKSNQPNSNPALNGNQMLDYPVGLLTQDEIRLVGNSNTSYLYNNHYYWTFSPSFFNNSKATVWGVNIADMGTYASNATSLGVRPAISLSSTVVASGGDGSMDSPYVIE